MPPDDEVREVTTRPGHALGHDVGTQYRSAIYYADEAQHAAAQRSREGYAKWLAEAGHREPTTQIAPVGEFYYAEDYHQQYLHKVPNGYCGLGCTGVSCPGGLFAERQPGRASCQS